MKSYFENKEICKKCGGRCCKRSGCNYLPTDFEQLSFDYLKKQLDKGEISIVAFFYGYKTNTGILIKPILHLRVRNVNRPIVDLLSKKTRCSMLSENGCKYSLDNRPTGGVLLIASEDGCYNLLSEEVCLKEWEKYQEVLKALVTYYTSNSLKEEIEIQVKQATEEIKNELILVKEVSKLSEESMTILETLAMLNGGVLQID